MSDARVFISHTNDQPLLTEMEDSSASKERKPKCQIVGEDPRKGDLLVIRIGKNRDVLKPLIFFGSSGEEIEKEVQDYEKNRYHEGIEVRLGFNGHRPKTFALSSILLCLIVPLGATEDETQNRQKDSVYNRLNMLLSIPKLLEVAEQASQVTCSCRKQWHNEMPMILCDNLQCKIGWYHHECVGLEPSKRPKVWYCKSCHRIRNKVTSPPTSVVEAWGDNLLEDIDWRVQRTNSFLSTWKKHTVPDGETVLKKKQEADLEKLDKELESLEEDP